MAQRQLQDEQKGLESSANVVRANAVTASESAKAVGPTVYLPIKVSGVPVEVMVDTGAQSTIISRSFLHQVGRHMKSIGKPLQVLEKPTARLYGKDGVGGGRELTITAQLRVTVEADGESVCVPVFVQPQSEQDCLLGMNVLPALGLEITRANGKPLITKIESESKVACVRLVKSLSIPSLKGCFLELEVDHKGSNGNALTGSDVLFEPQVNLLEPLGISTQESLVTVQKNGRVLVPIQNTDGGSSI